MTHQIGHFELNAERVTSGPAPEYENKIELLDATAYPLAPGVVHGGEFHIAITTPKQKVIYVYLTETQLAEALIACAYIRANNKYAYLHVED